MKNYFNGVFLYFENAENISKLRMQSAENTFKMYMQICNLKNAPKKVNKVLNSDFKQVTFGFPLLTDKT